LLREGLEFDKMQLRQWVKYAKRKHSKKSVTEGMTPISWDAVTETVGGKSRQNISSALSTEKFTDHTPYVVGTYEIDPKKRRVVVVISTENLLLNAYRQTLYGQDFAFNVDASYRYTASQHYGLLPIIVVRLRLHRRAVL
jgi:hypothetical protein